jgi:hypothetical protein
LVCAVGIGKTMPKTQDLSRHRRAPGSEEDGRRPLRSEDSGLEQGGVFERVRRMAAMIDFLDPLPGLANVHPSNDPPDFTSDASQEQADKRLNAAVALNPLTRRALEAVVAGLGKLSQSALDLKDRAHEPPTPDEMVARLEIGRSMRQLLERAQALVEPTDADAEGSAPATDPRASSSAKH